MGVGVGGLLTKNGQGSDGLGENLNFWWRVPEKKIEEKREWE